MSPRGQVMLWAAQRASAAILALCVLVHLATIIYAVRYGLTAYIWTRDVGRAHRVAQAVEAGMIWVNSENVRHLPTPFGGVKNSGIGRDGGDYSFDFYMETKNIAIALGDHKISRLGV